MTSHRTTVLSFLVLLVTGCGNEIEPATRERIPLSDPSPLDLPRSWVVAGERSADGWPMLLRDPRSGMAFCFIPRGRGVMGSKPGEGCADEEPQHSVVIDQVYYLAETEVTLEQWRRFKKRTKYTCSASGGIGISRLREWTPSPDVPVVNVTWRDATAFCVHFGYVLPSEVQWEYACRAGTTTMYWSGDSEDDLARVGWYWENSRLMPRRVFSVPPNPLGLRGMHGGAMEWCRDSWSRYDGSDAKPDYRVLRGGSFFTGANECRSAFRSDAPRSYEHYHVGFRPAFVPKAH